MKFRCSPQGIGEDGIDRGAGSSEGAPGGGGSIVGLPGVKGGYLGVLHTFPSEMAQNFWTAILAWTVCFSLTIVVSLFTRPRNDSELTGLVWSLTERPRDADLNWYQKPSVLAGLVLILVIILNIIFW